MPMRKLLKMGFHKLKNPGLIKIYDEMIMNERLSYAELEKLQLRKLKNMIRFCYEEVPYYKRFMRENGILPEDINSISDLKVFPIIDKQLIINNYDDFFPDMNIKGKFMNTGGTTGTPFRYKLNIEDMQISRSILWRGWGYAGYNLGDRIVTLGGGSIIQSRSFINRRFKEIFLNNYALSSYDMNDTHLLSYINKINKTKPKYIRGYASSLYQLSLFIYENNIDDYYRPIAIFSTAESLLPEYRKIIEKVFCCKVYDQYGLNDGGVSAYQCEVVEGYHIDMERSILEVVDLDGGKVNAGESGRIIATTLGNYAMPFIRYETGDIGVLSDERCECGRQLPILKRVVGRVDDFIIMPTGDRVHSGFVRVVLKEIQEINRFQAVQNKIDELEINIIIEDKLDSLQIQKKLLDAKNDIRKRLQGIDVTVNIVDSIHESKSNKMRFFISNLEKKDEI